MNKPTNVDEYVAGFDGRARTLLERLRTLCDEAAAPAEETLKWGSPAWVHSSGTILLIINGHQRWASIVFTPSTKDAFSDEIATAGYETGKGSIKLPYDQELPEALLQRMITYRIQEHEDLGVGWM